ncbi:MAG: hypothetical protein ACLRSW_05745 [Christensenellaceae bacterium]
MIYRILWKKGQRTGEKGGGHRNLLVSMQDFRLILRYDVGLERGGIAGALGTVFRAARG